MTSPPDKPADPGLSAASDGGRSTPIRGPSPRPSPLQGKGALAGPPLQQALTLKLVEFCENRGISAVVPLGGPGSEGGDPQLLGMSPEQVRVLVPWGGCRRGEGGGGGRGTRC